MNDAKVKVERHRGMVAVDDTLPYTLRGLTDVELGGLEVAVEYEQRVRANVDALEGEGVVDQTSGGKALYEAVRRLRVQSEQEALEGVKG